MFALFPMVDGLHSACIGRTCVGGKWPRRELVSGKKAVDWRVNSQCWCGKDQPVSCLAEGAAACTCLSVRNRYSVPGK